MKKRPKIAAANVAAAMMLMRLTQQGSLYRGFMKIKTKIKTIQTVRIDLENRKSWLGILLFGFQEFLEKSFDRSLLQAGLHGG